MTISTLTFSSLYPSATRPYQGLFVEQRLRHLIGSGEVSTKVVAPVPWFPFKHPRFGEYASFAATPYAESRFNIDIVHPRFLRIPKIGMTATPLLMASALYRRMMMLARNTPGYDLIDAHYFYPDGVAATILGRWLRKPVVITARGTDINLIPDYALPRTWIMWAAANCAEIITVSDALRARLIDLGADESKTRTLRNGVDLEMFRPMPDRTELRSRLGISSPTLLSVGHLIERKGHHLAIEAIRNLPGVSLMIVGDGRMRSQLENLVRTLDIGPRVRFAGAVAQQDLPAYYNAADAMVLASSREGMANVLLESIACGTPVVATPIWGTPEVISDRRAGILMEHRTAPAIVDAVNRLFADPPARRDVREFATRFSWDATTRGQIDVFRAVIAGAR